MPLTELPERFNATSWFVDRHVADGRGERVAFRSRGQRITYADLAGRVNRTGHVLAALGVEMEQRVLIVLPDSPAFVAAFWGAARIGAVAVPVNPLLGPAELEFVLNDSRAKVAIVDADVAPAIASVRMRCPFLRAVIAADVRNDLPAGVARLDELLAGAPGTLDAGPTSREDVMAWAYTSGSTGAPKAAVHLHQDYVAAADLVGGDVFGIHEDDLVFSASKMFFTFGLGNSLLFPGRVGGASVLVPERLDPERAFEVIAAERPTAFFAVATLYGRMLHAPDAAKRWDLSSLRLCVSSGETLPAAVFDAWHERFGLPLVDVVGSTEALHDFIANRPGTVRRGSCGQLVPGFEARLVDDDDRPVAPGEAGHLLVKGPTTAPYYWRRLDRSRRTMLGAWLRTGDMMTRDDDGYFYFAGRSDDMLKVAGQWVSPSEVEARLAEHPGVVEAAVVARRDGDGLVVPVAFVVPAPGAAGADLPSALRAFVRERLAGFKVPRRIELVAELPKTATGKIQRFRLRTP